MYRSLLALCLGFCCVAPTYGEEYQSADAAITAGALKIRARKFNEAIEPLEKALAMTPAEDRKKRSEIYETLLIAYRELPEIDKFQEAADYIQRNYESRPGRSIVARSYNAFLHQRGRTDWAVKHYEEVLKKDPRDPAALAVLSVFLSIRQGEEKQRGEELKAELEKLNNERSAKKAAELEASADDSPKRAASAWKDVARAWIEADDQTKAKAALEKARKAPPEVRSQQLTRMWHEGMGDSYAKLGDKQAALAEYEAALKLTDDRIFISNLEKKINGVKSESAKP